MSKIAFGILGLVASIAVVGEAKADVELRSLSGFYGGYETCLGVQSASRTVGANIVVWTCDQTYNQRWNQSGFWSSDARFARLTSRVLEKPTATSGNRCLSLNGSNQTVTASCTFNDFTEPNVRGWWSDFVGWYTINIYGVATSTPCYAFKSKTDTNKLLTSSGTSGTQPTLQNAISGSGWSQQVWCVADRTGAPGPY